jgi:biotin carboxyl carrier protein
MAVIRQYFTTADGFEGEYEVKVTEKAPGDYFVVVNGEEFNVDFQQINETIYSVIIDGKSYAIDMSEKGDKYDVIVNGDHFSVEVLDEMKRLMRKRTSGTVEGRQVIEAPMPGYIWKMLKEVGDEVKAGEPIMILVAMKMENEIKSPKDGVVTEIFVKASENPQESTVAMGDKLAVVE